MIRSKRVACAVAAATVGLALAGCSGAEQGTGGTADGRIAVTASTDVWGSVVSAVGGDAVEVTSIIDSPTDDPHDYESNSEDGLKVSKAQLVVSNGGGYDSFFDDVLASTGSKPRSVVAFDVSGKGGAGHEGHDHGAEPAAGHDDHQHGEVNEHVFYDLPTVRKVADSVAEQLGAIRPAEAKTFTSNAQRFDAGIDRLLAQVGSIGKDAKNATAVTTEPVADYLLDAAGVTNKTPGEFAEAVEHDIDIPAKALADTTALLDGKKVGVLVNNAQTETDTTNQLIDSAKRAGIPVVDVTETLPEGQNDYLAWMGKAVDGLKTALDSGR